MTDSFFNEPPLDFGLEFSRVALEGALQECDRRRETGEFRAMPVIGGIPRSTGERVLREDPSQFDTILGEVHYASIKDAEDAIQSLLHGQRSFASKPFAERAELLRKVAAGLRHHRLSLTALIIREAGKPWAEADGDVCEAIDFCEYYARQAVLLESGEAAAVQSLFGESNRLTFHPRGIAVVIAPWNFPLAILCGMTAGALVTGNATIIKAAEQTSLIAAEFFKILLEAGIPSNAVAFLPGRGEVVGRFLVQHPLVAIVCFTGSKAVGLQIMQEGAVLQPGQPTLKRIIAELGGKNAIIVDEDADLDEAIRGICQSAFGFAGQKCSACSRLIAVGTAYNTLRERLAAATEDLIVGSASDPATTVGPVIDKETFERIKRVIETGARNSRLIAGSMPLDGGYFLTPALFDEVSPQSFLWREEIFGPVLAMRRAANFAEALALANDSDYALTGGVFSRSPRNLAQARRDFDVGNLYINRGITGALVGRQPFGGHRHSGIGAKAGGPTYLLQFLDAKTVTENTMRKGFTPELG